MNKKIKIYEKNLISSIVENIKKIDSKNRIISIIITGSFGRNEPTYVIIDDNNYKLKSDIEIAEARIPIGIRDNTDDPFCFRDLRNGPGAFRLPRG